MSRKRVVLIALAAFAVIGPGALGLIVFAALRAAAASCPGGDFPRYAGSEQTSFTVNVGSVTECDAEFSAPASVGAVTEYMQAHLDAGDWQLVSTDPAQGVLTFQRRSHPSTTGQVQLLGQGDHTLLEVQIITN